MAPARSGFRSFNSMTVAPLAAYRKALERELKVGHATEPSHYPALKDLLESLLLGIHATNNPKRIEAGAPDFVVSRPTRHGPLTIGYIEAKDVGDDLESALKSEQLRRYLTLPNLVLTNYLAFNWFVDGKPRLSATLGRLGRQGKVDWTEGNEAVQELLRSFLEHPVSEIRSPKELAARMAHLAHNVRQVILGSLEADSTSSSLKDLRGAMAKALIPDLTDTQFADIFAQTIAYGLFAARANHRGSDRFKRLGAASEIPKTNPLLRQLFNFIAGPDLEEEPYAGFVEDLTQLLSVTDMDSVLADFGSRTKQEDPVVHFYETFLAAYDPTLRERRGVYYTPEPVVSYIVRSVDRLLKERFSLGKGLADTSTVTQHRHGGAGEKERVPATSPRVLILDPACGTGTFLYRVVDDIRALFMERGEAGMWSAYVREHLLPRLFGFELLMAPYAVAHLKLGLQLAGQDLKTGLRKEWAYDFGGEDRVRVFLTNTLDEAERRAQYEFGFLKTLTEESNAAVKIKSELPIMVVIGNPPYSGHSANTGAWIRGLVEDYKKECPELYKPAQAKWLHDDYVKFLRFGQYRIEKTGAGILAFITNHGYLDNPTFRGMRQSLMRTFDEIYILDLHGSSKKKEKSPDGSKDENVFDIQQGVAIGLFVKGPSGVIKRKIRHAEMWGPRDTKYKRLLEADIATTDWAEVAPSPPLFLFTPQDADLLTEYHSSPSLAEVMNQNGDPAPGIVTTQDEFAISFSKSEAIGKVERLLETKSEAEARSLFRLCSQAQWNYERAMRDLRGNGWRKSVTQILYRPFDIRWTVYDPNVAVHRRDRVMRHMIAGGNIGLVTTRQTRDEWDVLVTNIICGHKSCAAYDINYLFPLYLRQGSLGLGKGAMGGPSEGENGFDDREGRAPNINSDFLNTVADRLRLRFVPEGRGNLQTTVGPEDILHYIYAVCHSPRFRSRYAEFLKRDFPHIQLTSSGDVFRGLCKLGERLVSSHLFLTPGSGSVRFPQKGTDTVGIVRFSSSGKDGSEGRVWINGSQYFENVREDVWGYRVGGYKVCEKWLKDRKGRKLSHDDLSHYQAIVASLAETLRIAAEIDSLIPGWPLS